MHGKSAANIQVIFTDKQKQGRFLKNTLRQCDVFKV